MNILEIAAIAVFVFCTYSGYRKGFLRVLYSMTAWILILVFVTAAAPSVTDFLETHTKLKPYIQEKCIEQIAKKTEEKMAEISILPKDILEKFSQLHAETAEGIPENSSIYGEIAAPITDFIMQGIGFFSALLLASILAGTFVKVVDAVSGIPIIHGANQILGIAAGGTKGLLLIWIGMYLVSLLAGSQESSSFMQYIKESSFLSYLYQHNLFADGIRFFL